jgi:hypothetical protein
MRAGRFRGWRIRSPSSRNELIDTAIHRQARHSRAFLFAGPFYFLFPSLFYFPGPFFQAGFQGHIASRDGIAPQMRRADSGCTVFLLTPIPRCGQMMLMTATTILPLAADRTRF